MSMVFLGGVVMVTAGVACGTAGVILLIDAWRTKGNRATPVITIAASSVLALIGVLFVSVG